MRSRIHSLLLPLAAALASALVFTCAFSPAQVGDGKETSPVTYNLEGIYLGGGKVKITGGSRHAKEAKMIGETKKFLVETTEIDTRDLNDDGYQDYKDLTKNERLVIKTDLPKNNPGQDPYPARFIEALKQERPRCSGDDGAGRFCPDLY